MGADNATAKANIANRLRLAGIVQHIQRRLEKDRGALRLRNPAWSPQRNCRQHANSLPLQGTQVVEAGVTYFMCQLAFADLPLAASLQTISIMRSTIIPDLTRQVPAFVHGDVISLRRTSFTKRFKFER